MADTFFYIPDPPRHQTRWVGMIGVGLLIGVILFVIHIADKQTTNKTPPLTIELTRCTNNKYGEVLFITVEGTVYAHTKLNQTHLTAFANQRTVGTVSLGDFIQGEQKPFRVTGKLPHQDGKPIAYSVKLRHQNGTSATLRSQQ